MKDFKDYKKELLADPDICREYDELAPEFNLADKVIRLRLEQSLTQKELADLAGLEQSAIARLESGATNPRYTTIYRVFKALGKSLEVV